MAKEKKKLQQKHFEPDATHVRLNSILVLQRENDIIAMLLEGKDSKAIQQYICTKYKLLPVTASTYIKDARNLIKQRKGFEVNTLISLHIARYEKIYECLYEMGAHGIAMNALKAKEKLLSFHKEGFHLRVNSGEISTIQLQSVDNEYDVMKLTRPQRTKLATLLEKAKRDKNDDTLKKLEARKERAVWKKN